MINLYPYMQDEKYQNPEHEVLGRPRNRMEVYQARLRHERMNHRIEEMRDEQAAGVSKLDVVRAAVGGALIAAGERIGQEAMRRRERERGTAPYDTVRHA